jgi:hypothetical protein
MTKNFEEASFHGGVAVRFCVFPSEPSNNTIPGSFVSVSSNQLETESSTIVVYVAREIPR